MNCREFLKRMPELLDRDPDPASTAELMEHAGTCARCAAELVTAMSALSAVSPSLTLKASPGLKERTMKQILTLDSQPNAIRPASIGRRISIARPWRYVAAAAAVLAILAVFTFKGGSSNAFAEAMEQLRKVNACTYTLTTMMEGMPKIQMKTSYKEPGRMRVEAGVPGMSSAATATSIIDTNRKKLITLIHASKQCITYDLTGNTTALQQGADLGLFEELRRIPASGAQPIGTKQIGQCKAIGFRATRPGWTFTIWADPDKRQVLFVEYECDNVKGMKGELSDFNFDAKLDDSLFSLDPPKGYTVTDGQTLKMAEPSEEAFIKFLRKWAEEHEGNLFPPSLSPGDMMNNIFRENFDRARKSAMKADRSRKKTAPGPPKSESMQQNLENTLGLMFATQMTKANDFHYAGEGIALGNAQKPICWYKPTGAQNYRVIYGDLSVRETAPGNLPSTGTK